MPYAPAVSEYAYCHKITKYDPADFGAGGSYAGAEDSVSDHGPVESAYLEAVAAFVEETGVRHLTIREPQITDVVEVGEEVTVEVLDVDLARERISLSRKALLEDPLPAFVPRVGEIVSGRVTKLVPFGAFVRIGGEEDGFEGLVHNSELAEGTVARPEDVVAVGDELVVKITQVDRERRRMALSHRQTLEPSACAPEEDR